MKLILAIVAAGIIILTVTSGKQMDQATPETKSELTPKLDNGAYLASEFEEFRLANPNQQMNLKSPILTKVPFNAFMKSKKTVPVSSEADQKVYYQAFLANEFAEFKMANANQELYTENHISDRVLFKAFVKNKKAKNS